MAIGVGSLGRARRSIRTPPNPMDKSTIVSLFPKEINERKPTIEPGVFKIKGAKKGDFEVLTVGTSSWWRDITPEEPLLELTNSSIQVADSIVRDFINGLFMCDMGENVPGLFYVQGELTKSQVIANHKDKLDLYKKRQENWFAELIKAADILWARTNGNPLAISDDMKMAAEYFEMKQKGWMANIVSYELINCKFCGTLMKPGFAVCSTCHHVVDEKLYSSLGGESKKAS